MDLAFILLMVSVSYFVDGWWVALWWAVFIGYAWFKDDIRMDFTGK